MRRRLAALSVVVFIAGGCTNVHSAAPAAGTGRSDLRVAIPYQPPTLNPILSSTTYQAFVSTLFNDPLIRTTADGSMTPMLASAVPSRANGGISADGLTITYHLRPNVKWQDGAPFTSSDIVFSWRAVMNPKNNVTDRTAESEVKSIETPDPLTAVVHLKRRFAPFLAAFFTASWMLPEHVLRGLPELNDVPFTAAPVGLGPFRVVKWNRGSEIVLAANDAYYLGKPKLAGIVVKTIENSNTAALQLRTGEIDWDAYAGFPAIAHFHGDPAFRIVLQPVNGASSITMNTQDEILRDVRVRRAVSLAIDRPGITRSVSFGAATPSTGGDIPSFSWAYDPGARIAFDPRAARALLDQAGWLPGPGGIRMKNGKPLALTLLYVSQAQTAAAVGLRLQPAFGDVGIDLRLKGVDGGMLFAPAADGGILENGKFQLELSGFTENDDPDNSDQYSCESVAPRGFNSARWCTPELTRFQTAALTNYDRPARAKAYGGIERLIIDEAPAAVIYWPPNVHVISTKLEHVFRSSGTFNPRRDEWSIRS